MRGGRGISWYITQGSVRLLLFLMEALKGEKETHNEIRMANQWGDWEGEERIGLNF